MPGDVFISYAHEDRSRVESITQQLRARGFSVWTDAELPGARVWSLQLQHAIERCSAFVVLISLASVGSAFVRKELTFAVNKGRPLVPVRIDDTMTLGNLELLAADVQIVDCFGGDDVDEIAEAISAAQTESAYRRPVFARTVSSVLVTIGLLLVVGGFAGAIWAISGTVWSDTEPSGVGAVWTLAMRRAIVSFAVFFGGGVLALVGGSVRRHARNR